MERLWAPWRYKYVQKKSKGCLFCTVAKQKLDKENFIIRRSKFAFSMLNIYPYNNGHVMIAPYRHVKDLRYLSDAEILDIIQLVNETKRHLDRIMKPQGYNIGINIGKVSGAGFDKHIHIHIVPRWTGDTNFMPILTNTKVISQSLNSLYNKLSYGYKQNRKLGR